MVAGSKLRENHAAVKALSTMVRMPHDKHGSGKANEHWRGSRSTPPEQNPKRAAPGCMYSERSDMKKLKAQDYVGSRVGCDDDEAGLPVVRRGAAGIDLGSEEHWVCAPKVDGPGREVAKFGATTPELERMAAWLKERKVETVVATGTSEGSLIRGQGRHFGCVRGPHRSVLDRAARSAGEAWIGTDPGEYPRTGPSAGTKENGPGGLQMDPAAA